MQNLRDKLVKAGLANKKQAREARADARQERKQRGGARADKQVLQDQQARYEQKLADQASAAKEREELLHRQQAEREHHNRLQNLVRSHAITKIFGNDRPFYFVGRDRRIRRLNTTWELASRLASGQLAIVEVDDDPRRDFALVDAATAERLEQLEAAQRILFWNRDGAAEGELPAYGAC
jgi:uncharacterized protein YaiL (DUF2058 family)